MCQTNVDCSATTDLYSLDVIDPKNKHQAFYSLCKGIAVHSNEQISGYFRDYSNPVRTLYMTEVMLSVGHDRDIGCILAVV